MKLKHGGCHEGLWKKRNISMQLKNTFQFARKKY